MYRIKAFKNAEGFNQIFGLTQHGNGVTSRRNSILLAYYKSKSMWDYCRRHNTWELMFSITNMATLKGILMLIIRQELQDKGGFDVFLMGNYFTSPIYSTDRFNGVPTDGSIGFVRYITHEEKRNGKAYKMKAGKFFKKLIMGSELAQSLPEQVIVWLCEQFTEQWKAHVTSLLPQFTLHVDDRFDRIYSYNHCSSGFNSCMMDDDQWRFYRDSVQAKAAYLENTKGRIIARCVIFTNVTDQDGKVWRLAERQYAEDGSDLLKRCLVDALVSAGEIDGYKQVGVDCHNNRAYLDVNGNSLSEKEFSIACDLEFSRDADEAFDGKKTVLSYQDSFKWYDYNAKRAYNYYVEGKTSIEFDTTQCYIYDNRVWDDYHGHVLCDCINWVWYRGEEITCDQTRMEDFVYCGECGCYIHKDEVVKCPHCGELMPDPNKYCFGQRDFRGVSYCSRECVIVVRDAWRDKYCFYDVFRGEYYQKSEYKAVAFLHFDDYTIEVRHTKFGGIVEMFNEQRLTVLSDGLVVWSRRAPYRQYKLRQLKRIMLNNPGLFSELASQVKKENEGVADFTTLFSNSVVNLDDVNMDEE